MKSDLQLSVIIPTRDHADLLDRTLASVARQKLPAEQFEIIVIDNGSSDETPAVCESWAARLPHFRSVFESQPGLHVGRNLAMKLARADILVYADDDIQAEPSWLQSIAGAFEDSEVGLVGGNNLPDYESPPPPWFQGLTQQIPFGWMIFPLSVLNCGTQPRDIDPGYVWGCNYSIRKSLLRDIGGFHPDGMPAELLHLRGDGESYVSTQVVHRGKRIRFSPGATIRHFTPTSRMTVSYLRDRGFRQGVSRTYSVLRRFNGLSLSAATILATVVIKSRTAAFASSNQGKKALLRGYVEGIRWHLRYCGKSPDTIAWILKKNYVKSESSQ